MAQQFSDEEVGPPVQSCSGPSPDPKHWIEIQLYDEAGDPVPYEEYCITLPDGVEVYGSLDSSGRARVEGIENHGTCKVTFPRLDKDSWNRSTSPPSAGPGS